MARPQQGAFPEGLAKTNKFKAPTWSVIASAAIVQFFIVVIYINASAYQAVYALSTSAIMVPYVFSAFYYLKLVIRGEGLEEGNHNKAGAWIIAIIGSVYGVWLLYASGVTYILAATILYAPGTLMYLYNRKKKGEKYFATTVDMVICICLMIALVAAIVLTANGTIRCSKQKIFCQRPDRSKAFRSKVFPTKGFADQNSGCSK